MGSALWMLFLVGAMLFCGALGARWGSTRRIGGNKGFAVGCLLAPLGPLLVLLSRGGEPIVQPPREYEGEKDSGSE